MRRRLTGVATIAAGLLFALAGCGSDSASSGGGSMHGNGEFIFIAPSEWRDGQYH